MKLKILLSISYFFTFASNAMAPKLFQKLNGWYDITNFKKEQILQESEYGEYKDLNVDSHVRKIYFNKSPGTLSGLESPVLSFAHAKDIRYDFVNSPRTVLFVLHGTGSAENPWTYDYNHPTFKALLDFATNMADNGSVEVVSFKWSGRNDAEDRQAAGKALAELINRNYSNVAIYKKIITFAHSHGGNVVNNATNDLKRPIDVVANLFTPARSDFVPNDKGFKEYYNFYSSGDQIQFLGSFSFPLSNWQSFSSVAISEYPELAKKALSLASQGITNILSGGRKIKGSVINIRLLIDGLAPSHVESKMTFVKYLKEVFDKTNQLYQLSDDLDLNIDTKAEGEEKIYLVVRHPLDAKNIISKLNLEDPEQIKNFMHRLELEKANSDQETARFKKKYGWNIWEKGLRITDFATEWLKLIKVKECVQ